MDKINLEIKQDSDGNFAIVMQAHSDSSGFMYFLAGVLNKSLPEIIKSTKKGYEKYNQKVNPKQTTH